MAQTKRARQRHSEQDKALSALFSGSLSRVPFFSLSCVRECEHKQPPTRAHELVLFGLFVCCLLVIVLHVLQLLQTCSFQGCECALRLRGDLFDLIYASLRGVSRVDTLLRWGEDESVRACVCLQRCRAHTWSIFICALRTSCFAISYSSFLTLIIAFCAAARKFCVKGSVTRRQARSSHFYTVVQPYLAEEVDLGQDALTGVKVEP